MQAGRSSQPIGDLKQQHMPLTVSSRYPILITCPYKSTFGRSGIIAQGFPNLINPHDKPLIHLACSFQNGTKICVHMYMRVCVVPGHLPCTKCQLDCAMQVPVVGINSMQDASCGSQGHCNGSTLSKNPYLDDQENAHPRRQHPQSDSSNLPNWYWLGPMDSPYELMDAKVEGHIKPQTIDCLNHLRRQRTTM